MRRQYPEREEGEQERETSGQLGLEEAEAASGSGEDKCDRVAEGACEEVTAEKVVRLDVADHWLDGGAPSDLVSHGGCDAALLAREEDAGLVSLTQFEVSGVLPAPAAVEVGALDGHAGDALGPLIRSARV